jgi:hypothetical protein
MATGGAMELVSSLDGYHVIVKSEVLREVVAIYSPRVTTQQQRGVGVEESFTGNPKKNIKPLEP